MTWGNLPLLHARVLWRPEQYNRVTNGGFETDVTGWSIAAGINVGGTSILRSTAEAKFGSASGALVTSDTDGSGVHWDCGTDTYYWELGYGTAYAALVWLKRNPSGPETHATITLGSEGTTSDRSSVVVELSNDWRPYRVVWMPSANRTDVQLAITNRSRLMGVWMDGVTLYQLDAFSQVENANFTVDTTGWAAVGGGSVTRQASGGYFGTFGRVVTTSTTFTGVQFLFGDRTFVAGRTYRLRFVAREQVPTPVIRYSLGGSVDVATGSTTLSTGTWQILELDWTPATTQTVVSARFGTHTATAITFDIGGVEVYEATDDVSRRVQSLEWSRGANFDGSADGVGQATMVLSDSDRRYDPFYATSPIAGSVSVGRRMWARAFYGSSGAHGIFYGSIGSISTDRGRTGSWLTTVQCEDPLLDLQNASVSRSFAERTYRTERAGIFGMSGVGTIGDRHTLLSSARPETQSVFAGTDAEVSALDLLTQLNEATGTVHFILPSAIAEYLWFYKTIARTELFDSSSAETLDDEFDDIGPFEYTREALENRQTVSWQGYEQLQFTGSGALGYGIIAAARDRGVGYTVDDEDPYLHFMSDDVSTEDNVPPPTFETYHVWRKANRKKHRRRKLIRRKRRVFADPFVPFTVRQGHTKRVVLDFAVPVEVATVTLDSQTTDHNNVVVTTSGTPRQLIVDIAADDTDRTIDSFEVNGRAWRPLEDVDTVVMDHYSAVDEGIREGVAISTPYIATEAQARGIGEYRNWRYSTGRLRPTLVRKLNHTTGITGRNPGDHLTVNAARWSISGTRFVIRSLRGAITSGATRWDVSYDLEEIGLPTVAWFTLNTSTLNGTHQLFP